LNPSDIHHTTAYVMTDSTSITLADIGFAISKGTKYPGTTSPDRTHPNRKLKNTTTHTPTNTVVVIEIAIVSSGKIARLRSAITLCLFELLKI
jgi:hypothetical protein